MDHGHGSVFIDSIQKLMQALLRFVKSEEISGQDYLPYYRIQCPSFMSVLFVDGDENIHPFGEECRRDQISSPHQCPVVGSW